MSFLDFTRIIFEFSFLLTHMSLWMVFMLVLRFLEFYMSNDPNSKLKLWNLKNSGLSEIWWCGQSAGKRRTVRRSCNLFTRGSAEKFSTAKFYRGRSACAGQNSPEAVSVGCQCKDSMADGPLGYRGQSATGQNGGVGQTWLIMDVPLTPLHQTAHNIKKSLSLFLSQARGGDDKVKAFWRGSRTVRKHPRTLLKIVHHVLSVFWRIPNSCSWFSLLERVRVRCSDLFLDHGFLKIFGWSCF